jgi:alpha-1,2-mannosyltransferase
VWAVPVALVLWERSRWAGAAWTAVFVARPVVWPPYGQGREYAWSAFDHVVGNAYLLAALALSVWAAATLYRRVGSAAGRTHTESVRANPAWRLR